MAEKHVDWAKLSKKELLEMLQRQKKLLANKKFLLSLPDKGRKVSETVERLKELIAQREKLEDTVAQFERLTVTQLVQRTQLDVLDSDDDYDDDNIHTPSGTGHQATGDLHKEMTSNKHSKITDTNESRNKQFSSQSSGRTWDYESSATPPTYKLEKAKPLSLEDSFKLLQDQEKRQKDLQAQHASLKLREQSSFAKTDHTTLQALNPLQYRERVQDDYSSDDSRQEEDEIGLHEMDSDDDDNEEKS